MFRQAMLFIPAFFMMLYLVCLPFGNTAKADDGYFRILVLGDSLTSGYGLKQNEAYPAVLESILHRYGYPARIINGGVSGDTMRAGLRRLPFHLRQDNPHLVIVALGANDALRALDINATRKHLDEILTILQDNDTPAALMGMKAPRNMGEAYIRAFDSIYPEMAQKYNVPLYPFFLEGVAMVPQLNLRDGVHPNARGVQTMATNTAPFVMSIVHHMLSEGQ